MLEPHAKRVRLATPVGLENRRRRVPAISCGDRYALMGVGPELSLAQGLGIAMGGRSDEFVQDPLQGWARRAAGRGAERGANPTV